ncbi:hypothetical protein GHK53_10660 [Sinorhizobium meliloti]|uniref:Uncharacterized protein n=1 Tax=Rhizobium meliloti TaxID=382 RepID=A0AAW9TMS4_RHIML|nr:hypothetical protein [Sinorhizobium meliloti]
MDWPDPLQLRLRRCHQLAGPIRPVPSKGTASNVASAMEIVRAKAGSRGSIGPLSADSDEAAPLFRDDCAPGFRDDLAPCLVGSAGDDCCQFIQARCQALRGRFRRRLSPLNSMRWALWTNLSSMASA